MPKFSSRGFVRAAFVLTVPFLAATSPPTAEAAGLTAHEQTCRHYENRARYKDRDGRAGFLVVLADSCGRALSGHRDPAAEPARAAIAGEYLRRLTAFRTTVADINRERVFGPDASARAKPLAPARRDGRGGAGTVTLTGEYLIGRSMGVLQALVAWQAASGRDVAALRGGEDDPASLP